MKKTANKFKDISALSALDKEGIEKEIRTAEKELFLLNMKHRANELKQSHTLKLHKKYLARLHMVAASI